MTACIVELEEVPDRSTWPFSVTFEAGGEPWDITGATVTLILRSPAGTESTKSASILVAEDGTARYVSTITDLVATRRVERWTRSWRVQLGAIDERSLPVAFLLRKSP